MTLPAADLPLEEADPSGVRRVAGTRVPLDNLVHEYLAGATPEEIAASYPTVPLATINTLIGHYLANRVELDAEMRRNAEATDSLIEEGRHRQAGLRSRLSAKLKEAAVAPVSGG